MACIKLYEEQNRRGNEYVVERKDLDNKNGVKEMKDASSVGSIRVESGTWLLYTINNYLGASFLLKPATTYSNPGEISKHLLAQDLHEEEQWTGNIRSLRLITPGSLMLFDDDYFRGKWAVYNAPVRSIGAIDSESMMVAPFQPTVAVGDGSQVQQTSGGQPPSWSASSLRWPVPMHPADRADINTVETSEYAGAWVAAVPNNQDQWLMRDLGEEKVVTGIVTKGRNYSPDWPFEPNKPSDQYTTSYTISYGIDNGDEKFYRSENNEIVVFKGNTDRDTEVRHDFNTYNGPNAIIARYIKFHPQKWHESIAMRAAIITSGFPSGWVLYQYGDFAGKEWKAPPGNYTSEDLKKNFGEPISSAKRYV